MHSESPIAAGMSVSQEREETADHSEALRPESALHTCVALSKDTGAVPPPPSNAGAQTPRAPSPVPSCVSLKSDCSKDDMPNFSNDPVSPHPRLIQDQSSCEQVLRDPAITSCENQSKVKQDADNLRRVIENHKTSLKRRYQNISEGTIKPGAEILLNDIYTELYITEGESEGVNNEHEVWQVEFTSRQQTTEEAPINCNDIFKPLPGQERHIKTVMTKGVAGIGKTVSVQKFILDWTEGKANQNVDFIFPLPFRVLNLIRNDQYSLQKLLLNFHPELEKLEDGNKYKECQILFIFDGLDESRLTLDFEQDRNCCDVQQTSSVDVLISSLIQGTLLPSALIWITSRPAAANQIPQQYINQVTEVRGFNDPQKEEYFRKRISDESLSKRIISHIKASRSLFIMCYIPVFCWIAATVLQQMLKKKIPKTLTEMFIHFLLIQTARKGEKYHTEKKVHQDDLLESQTELIVKLAELAFKNLESGNLMFYDKDLRECNIDVSDASVYSGFCTEIFKEDSVFQQKVYCFVHLSIQEFLAALYSFYSFVTGNHAVLKSILSDDHIDNSKPSSFVTSLQSTLGLKNEDHLHVLLKNAVDAALKSQNGHMDLFLRFLCGMSLERNQGLLKGLLTQTQSSSSSIKETSEYIKKLNADLSPERCINLFHCMLEMNDESMHKEIQKYMSSPKKREKQLSPAHCSALAHMLLMSEEVLDEFDLKSYNTSDEGRRRLLPAVRSFWKARLVHCNLIAKSCEIVASVLQSPNSLVELNLSGNALGDSGVEFLSKGLSSPHCRLQMLRLADCNFVKETCEILASILQSQNDLTELDLSLNVFGEFGVQLLSQGLSSPHCKLQTLRLAGCKVTANSCKIVASVLHSPNTMRELYLFDNDLGDSGVQHLCKGLSSPHCTLQSLRLSGCRISEKGCTFLETALTSNPSHLEKLDLSYNHPGESGLKRLSARLKDPHYKLETLNTDHCSRIRLAADKKKYACDVTLDPNTAHSRLSLSEGNRKVTHGGNVQQPYPDHRDKLDCYQVLCREGLSGRCYWEVEWSGDETDIAVAYKSTKSKWGDDVIMGQNAKSWRLSCSTDRYSVCHNKKRTAIPAPSSRSRRVGVYLDWPAGTLSFYSVSSDTLTHLHTFHSTFTEPLYPGFIVFHGSVSLCQVT
ncbi:NACHT, LRR and PYD domains-containing protein 3-like [Engraulis encrasicolus]|uniref:NACHT, LRR and PYD domains-containing protein 3-like n=1 Tax=Engraulis encrasicolus TaxID=184585 RepID=UPI002FCEA4A9